MSAKFYSALRILMFTCLYFNLSIAVSKENVLQIQLSNGATLRTLISGNPDKSKAKLILLVGGSGILKITEKGEIKKETSNFLARSRQMFVASNYLIALVDAPLKKTNRTPLLGGFRASEQHAADLEKIAKNLFASNGKPVIVVGTSRGTVSAANLGLRDKSGTVKAVILASSLVKRNRRGTNLNTLSIENLNLPLLLIHNKNDRCKTTLLRDVQPLAAGAKNSGLTAELMIFESSARTSAECKGNSPHGFLGIEDEVIVNIDKWILSTVLQKN